MFVFGSKWVSNRMAEWLLNILQKYDAEHKSGEGGHLYFEQGKLTN